MSDPFARMFMEDATSLRHDLHALRDALTELPATAHVPSEDGVRHLRYAHQYVNAVEEDVKSATDAVEDGCA